MILVHNFFYRDKCLCSWGPDLVNKLILNVYYTIVIKQKQSNSKPVNNLSNLMRKIRKQQYFKVKHVMYSQESGSFRPDYLFAPESESIRPT
jgi:hypothetical protein